MAFVSYAQNFEDVMLWRALGQVEHGFYVDVGAHDPELDSVSKAFYDRGWSGINVEPVPHYAASLTEARPRDRTFACAISNAPGALPLFVFDDTGLSTLEHEQATRNEARLGIPFSEITVPTKALRDVLAEADAREVHWLKIDVEGAEEDVLRSWQGSRVMPWIVVVESTRPNEPTEAHESWEPILLDAGFRFVYFDGLNRFYVSPAHPELVRFFGVPPNVFDDFVLAGVDRSRQAFEKAETYANSLAARMADSEAYTATLVAKIAETETYAKTLVSKLDDVERYASSMAMEIERRDAAFAAITGPGGSLAEAEAYAFDLKRELGALGDAYRSLQEHVQRSESAHRTAQEALKNAFDEAAAYAKSLEAELKKQSDAAGVSG